jgi:hypothetical protein
MIARSYQPVKAPVRVEGAKSQLQVTAARSQDGKTLVLRVVNGGDRAVTARLRVEGFTPTRPEASVEELSGPIDGVNTADEPRRVAPRSGPWRHGLGGAGPAYEFPPRSFTILTFE